jgi:hypothetical protein
MTQDEIKKLVERYPYLLPRNVWTDKIPEDYDYTYIRGLALPRGWHKLFFQLCEDIRQPLIDAGYLDKFRFSQIKEKYNRLECYNFGAPEAVQDIIDKYSVMAKYVCTVCGKPAVYETRGYIASYCDYCWRDLALREKGDWLHFKSQYKISGWKNGEAYEKTISFEDEWNRYIASLED